MDYKFSGNNVDKLMVGGLHTLDPVTPPSERDAQHQFRPVVLGQNKAVPLTEFVAQELKRVMLSLPDFRARDYEFILESIESALRDEYRCYFFDGNRQREPSRKPSR